MNKKWSVKKNIPENSQDRKKAIIDILLENRGLLSEEEKESFFKEVNILELDLKDVGVKNAQILKFINRLKEAKENREKIVIYGDYDTDGVTATAILWEVLNSLGFSVMPFLPHREKQGYGLKPNGIDAVTKENGKVDLIITVDNGIVGFEGADYCKKLGIDLLITDHHEAIKNEKGKENYPDCIACIHSTHTSGAGIAFLVGKKLLEELGEKKVSLEILEPLIEIATIGVIADLVPLLSVSRKIAKKGLAILPKTKRPGLSSLFAESGMETGSPFSSYHVGFVIAPRLNASGRLDHPIDSLRLLCTKDESRAMKLAVNLAAINKDRQDLTGTSLSEVVNNIRNSFKLKNIIITASGKYNPGVIGLIAGKLTEQFYRPSIAIAIMGEYAKGSARSVSGVNIIEFLRNFENEFVDLGGHSMAAGFTVLTSNLEKVTEKLENFASENISSELLIPTVEAETEVNFSDLDFDLYNNLENFSPFGIGNPNPVFMVKNAVIKSMVAVGKKKEHVKMTLFRDGLYFDGIMFGGGEIIKEYKIGDTLDIIFQLDVNEWNGSRKLQLMIKDVRTHF
jgi:single-stranded-DNA-specific exonuclease